MRFPRSSGILMPIFSLSKGAGIGDLGIGAREFVDFLHASKQSIWQLLPLGPTARGDSPYSSYSAFAGNPLLICCRQLVKDGLLSDQQLADGGYRESNTGTVDYAMARAVKKALLALAFEVFRDTSKHQLNEAYDKFCEANEQWLDDFALFESLAGETGESDWSQWPAELVAREPHAISKATERLKDPIRLSKFEQFIFDLQWKRLKSYANEKQVRIFGDMPIFVAFESSDVWCHQQLFQLSETGRPTVVAGVPPDYFSPTGQKWGNPLYRWESLAESGFDWWIKRLKQAFEFFDLLRIDHFRGFESYWEIPAEAEDATTGQWKSSPGDDLFNCVKHELGDLAIVAEDLGLITDEVHALRERVGFPGMRVIQFGYDNEHDSYHRPESFPSHSVGYTGTHDNDTLVGWYRGRCEAGANNGLLDHHLKNGPEHIHTDLIRALFHSAADTIVTPIQDLMGLGSSSRMNTPGEPDGNWKWRCPSGTMSDHLANQLATLTTESDRLVEGQA